MNVMFIFAHPDDEVFGPLGTLMKHVAVGDNVLLLSCCKGDRPGNEHVDIHRQQAFRAVADFAGATASIGESSDLYLDYHSALNYIEPHIKGAKPSIVYTHSINDIHRDHRVVAEAVMSCCRPAPGSPVNTLYMSEVVAATDWSFGQFGGLFNPNTFVDITGVMEEKRRMVKMYGTELRPFPDARSEESMVATASFRGKQAGFVYAEAFQLVFSRHRIV